MPNGHQAGSLKERNTHKQGRVGSGTPKKPGPVRSVAKNPTMKGGINRATKGR